MEIFSFVLDIKVNSFDPYQRRQKNATECLLQESSSSSAAQVPKDCPLLKHWLKTSPTPSKCSLAAQILPTSRFSLSYQTYPSRSAPPPLSPTFVLLLKASHTPLSIPTALFLVRKPRHMYGAHSLVLTTQDKFQIRCNLFHSSDTLLTSVEEYADSYLYL